MLQVPWWRPDGSIERRPSRNGTRRWMSCRFYLAREGMIAPDSFFNGANLQRLLAAAESVSA
ncbi:MAG TPA: hypothetical protein VFR86_08465 [Burkholderiaceae bacterium]|nr:hypothetical protein [Burkholderiaceae bacterium]